MTQQSATPGSDAGIAILASELNSIALRLAAETEQLGHPSQIASDVESEMAALLQYLIRQLRQTTLGQIFDLAAFMDLTEFSYLARLVLKFNDACCQRRQSDF